jgi:hypothetical protein
VPGSTGVDGATATDDGPELLAADGDAEPPPDEVTIQIDAPTSATAATMAARAPRSGADGRRGPDSDGGGEAGRGSGETSVAIASRYAPIDAADALAPGAGLRLGAGVERLGVV